MEQWLDNFNWLNRQKIPSFPAYFASFFPWTVILLSKTSFKNSIPKMETLLWSNKKYLKDVALAIDLYVWDLNIYKDYIFPTRI